MNTHGHSTDTVISFGEHSVSTDSPSVTGHTVTATHGHTRRSRGVQADTLTQQKKWSTQMPLKVCHCRLCDKCKIQPKGNDKYCTMCKRGQHKEFFTNNPFDWKYYL